MTLPEQISEAAFQRTILDLANLMDWLVGHSHDSRRQVRRRGVTQWVGDAAFAGFPDLVLARAPRVIFAELKSAKGRLTDKQRRWLYTLCECPGVEVYVWRPADWPMIEQVLTNPTPPQEDLPCRIKPASRPSN